MAEFIKEISSNGIVLALLGFLSSYLMLRVQSQKERIKNIENQLSDKKYQVYHKIVSIFYNILNDVLDKKPFDSTIYKKELLDCKRDLLIYGSDQVFNKFSEWLQLSGSNDFKAILNVFLELMVLIRKDMGNSKTILTKDDVLLSIMQNKAEFETIKNLIS